MTTDKNPPAGEAEYLYSVGGVDNRIVLRLCRDGSRKQVARCTDRTEADTLCLAANVGAIYLKAENPGFFDDRLVDHNYHDVAEQVHGNG